MSRPQSKYVRVDPANPRAAAQCDLCSRWYNHDDLQWNFEWGGTKLYNTGSLRCRVCIDVPQEQLRSIVLPADPVPILNARVPDFEYSEYTVLISQFAVQPSKIEVSARFLGFIVAQQLTVVEVLSGSIDDGDQVFGAANNTFITSQIAGSPGGAGAYSVSKSQTLAPTTLVSGEVSIPSAPSAANPPWGAGPQMIMCDQTGEIPLILQYLTSS